jgi:hypothetical protein
MPITTRTIAKGVPPRVHEPKGKAKPRVKKANTSTAKPSLKRVASESEDEELENGSEPRLKKKQNTTHQPIEESESDIEVEENTGPPEEEVEDLDETHASSDVQEVSAGHQFKTDTHQYLGGRP